ncbi:EutN/CcmL family microcompartment protein [Haliangium ochraceum]|uniref:Ethanolamine utilization protein EutN/carboxysome structural protein Ccml n=1 Tax=Haliangium ochraceum (strain DSM 14365 / JCM 11303 / SMP-2) TaxID=502025 RepID=D0LNL5_HALO1|nr:EutN/CcmL family microcompartment protein [Haliangium ochraceum]ACY16920.1 Ethanolamine utilization protein EutN/carboxysome structural protein Ccml [Haliangium ochraceum DSM 14365]
MRLCRVLGSVVATVKHPVYNGLPLMIVQPLDDAGRDAGASFLAVDNVQSGPGDRVLVLTEGGGVRQILALGDQVPIRSLIVGVVDAVDGVAATGVDDAGGAADSAAAAKSVRADELPADASAAGRGE